MYVKPRAIKRSTSRSRGVSWSSSGSKDGCCSAAGSAAKASSTNPARRDENTASPSAILHTASTRSAPEIVFVTLPPDLARTEPDAEIQSLIGASSGLNVALDYLPGSVNFDPLVYQPDAKLASAVVWFDAFVCNVDRTARNVNMLMWHRRLWLIDHGAALYFHHAWNQHDRHALTPFSLIKDHVLLKYAGSLEEADAEMRARIVNDKIAGIVELIPDAWLADDPGFESKAQQRSAYLNYFMTRLATSDIFLKEALRARAAHL